MIDAAVAWSLTYWLHSTIALGVVWAASRALRKRNLAVEEASWRVALFVTFLTATAQFGLSNFGDWRPLAGAVEVGSSSTIATVRGVRNATAEPSASAGDSRAGGSVASVLEPKSEQASRSAPVRSFAVSLPAGWRRGEVLVAIWISAAGAMLLRLGISYFFLFRNLRSRSRMRNGRPLDLLARLCVQAEVSRSVALTVCRALLVPMAIGIRRWEVCLPEKVADGFGPEEQETVLAHELAHLVRRDTLWQFAARSVSCLFFLQPLNFVAVARLRTIAELRCDDWAVARTGRPVTLAKCLTRVASWRTGAWRDLPVPAMASSNCSEFGRRVRRLLARGYPEPKASVPRWLKLAAIPLVLAFVAAAPGAVEPPAMAPAPPARSARPVRLTEVAPVAGAPSAALAPVIPALEPTAAALAVPARGVRAPAPPSPEAPAVALEPEAFVAPAAPTPQLVPITGPAALAGPGVAPVPRPAVGPGPPPVLAPVAAASAESPATAPAGAGTTTPGLRRTFTRTEPHLAGTGDGSDEEDASCGDSYSASVSDSGDDEWGPEADEMEVFDDALDEEIESLEDELESQIEILEDELESQMGPVEEATEAEYEALYEEFESRLDDDVEGLEEELEERADDHLENGPSREQERAVERVLKRQEAELERFEERQVRELERLSEDFERSVEGFWARDVERHFERAIEEQELLLEHRIEAAERQMEAVARRWEAARDSESRERLRAELREHAERARPSAAELAEMRARLAGARTELEPRMAEMQRARERFRGALEEWRARYAVELAEFSQRQRQLLRKFD